MPGNRLIEIGQDKNENGADLNGRLYAMLFFESKVSILVSEGENGRESNVEAVNFQRKMTSRAQLERFIKPTETWCDFEHADEQTGELPGSVRIVRKKIRRRMPILIFRR